jgi:hypothetical protein
LTGPFVGVSFATTAMEVSVDHATPLIPLLYTPQDPTSMENVVKFLKALKILVNDTKKFYQEYNFANVDELQIAYPYCKSFMFEDSLISFKYVKQLLQNKLLFVVEITSDFFFEESNLKGLKVLVKFTKRYSIEAHKAAYSIRLGAP